LGFVAGVALTSGVFYVASKKHAPPPIEPVQAAQAIPVSAPAPVEAHPPVVEPVKAAPEPTESQVHAPKPSAVVTKHRAQKIPVVEVAQTHASTEPVAAPEAPSEPTPPAETAVPAPTPAPAVVEPEPVPAVTPAPAPEPPAAPEPHSVTVTAGTLLTVRMGQTISSEQNVAGDTFTGTLDQPLVIDGFIIAERGSRVQGRVVEADRAGRVKGRALVAVELTRFHTSDGQDIRVQTQAFERQGSKSTGEDAAKVGIGAAIGAIIGAVAGGGKGAGIGAGVGGAAGAGSVMMTRGKSAVIPVETRLSFRVQEPVTITEQLQ
jgi:hypothetical protein